MMDAVLMLIGVLVLATPVAEMIARIWLARGGYFPFVPYMRQRFQLDQEVLPDLPSPTRLEINSRGERGSEPPNQETDALRILVAGGSGAECYLLDQSHAWPAVAERSLTKDYRDTVHVGNISRSLLTCASLAKVLEKCLPRYPKLDLVITFVGAADVVSWLEKDTPALVEDENLPLDFLFQQNPETQYRWSVKDCALRRLAIRLTRRFFHPVEHRESVGRTIARNRDMRANATHWIDHVPDPAPMVECFERNLRRMIDAAQNHGARVMIVRQPWLEREFTEEEKRRLWNFGRGRPYEGELDSYYTLPVAHRLLRTLDSVQTRVAHELGLTEIGLIDQLPMDFDHFYDSFHFTPKGAECVGQRVAEAIPMALKST
jgi:lysophospholipase L1-like esterase